MTNRATALLVTGMVVSGLVMLGVTPTSAAPPKEQCWRWGIAQKVAITAVGPGVVTVDGVSIAETITGGTHCRRAVEVIGYKLDGTLLSNHSVTGPANPYWNSGDAFIQQLVVPVGTEAVCVRTETGTHVSCHKVEVRAGENGSPATPTIVGPIPYGQPPTGEGDGPVDVCGNCV
jgi:hypothetical protein